MMGGTGQLLLPPQAAVRAWGGSGVEQGRMRGWGEAERAWGGGWGARRRGARCGAEEVEEEVEIMVYL